MPKLSNPLHEEVAKDYVRTVRGKKGTPSLTKSYKKVYDCSKVTADSNAYKPEIARPVKQRIRELLEKREKLSLRGTLDKVEELYEAKNESVQADMAKTVLKMHGVFEEGEDTQAPIIINKVVVKGKNTEGMKVVQEIKAKRAKESLMIEAEEDGVA